jgi:uncharacterized protein (DUF58 family)
MKLSHASRWLVALVILGSLAGWMATGLVTYARLVYFGIILLGGAFFWTILSINGMRLNRETRSLRASMGEVFEEHYEIKKEKWPGCSWLEVLNQSTLPFAAGSRLLTRVEAHQVRYFSARTLLTRRGAYLLGPTILTTGDPFGLFTMRKEVTAKDTLVILPMTFPITLFPPPPGVLPGGKTIRQRTPDMTPNAAEVREYVPGDPMKRIHWPSTARRNQLMVKEFEQDPQADIWILLDAYRPVHYFESELAVSHQSDNMWLRRPKVQLSKDTFEYAVSVAASLARFFLMDRRAVGLASSAGNFFVVPCERGERQINKIMETLAFVQPEGVMPLFDLVNIQAKLLPLGSGVILITTSSHPDMILALEDLQRRHLRPVVVLIKSESFGGRGENEKIVASLQTRNIPVCQISLGDDLGAQLVLPAMYLQKINQPKASTGSRI